MLLPAFSHLSAILAYGLITLFTYSLLRILYLISPFHPLNKFPGPRLWAVCRIFWAYHQFKGDLVFQIKALHDIYGPVVRIAPYELSFTDNAAWRDIYTANNSLKQQLPRDPYVLPPPPPDVPGDGLIFADDVTHARLRKQLGYAFNIKALEEQQSLIQRHIETLVNQFHKFATASATTDEKSTSVIDFAKWTSLATFDIVSELAFGEPSGCLEHGEYNDLAARITGSNATGALLSCLARFGLLPLVWKLNAREMARQQKEFNNLSLPVIERRMQEHEDGTDGDKRDFCSYILGKREDGESHAWRKEDMQLLAISFIVAGTETTGTTLAATMWFLLKNPRCMAKLTAEIRGAFQEQSDIDMAGTSKLPYLMACIEEGLRLATPAPFSVARKTPADMTVAGLMIPKGTSVGVPQYAAWHVERNFERPMDFAPERWLDSSDQFVAGEKKGFVPFGVGPRSCIGKK